MNNDILLLNLKRMRYKVKLAAETTKPLPFEEEEVEVVEEEPGPDEVFVTEDDPDEDSPLNWRGETPTLEEWNETPTKLTVDPFKAREQVKRFVLATGGDPAEVDRMTEEQVKRLQEDYDKWQQHQYEASQGMVPGSGGMMTEESRQQGLERTKQERPEMFDPARQKMMKDWKSTYFRYHDPIFPGDRKTQLREMMEASRGYVPERLNDDLAASLAGIMHDYLWMKTFAISIGSPTLPKIEMVKIVDVDPREQKIIFQSVQDPRFKYFSSYDDFFYHPKWDGKSDGARALITLGSGVELPSKSWIEKAKRLLKIPRPGAKV